MIRILLVDDHGLFRSGMRSILETQPDIEVVAEAESGEQAVELVRQSPPDVVLMDVHMPGTGGIEATRRVLRAAPEARVIALTALEDEPFPRKLLDAGAEGYLTKGCPAEELLKAIRQVAGGERYVSGDVLKKLGLSRLAGGEKGSPPCPAVATRDAGDDDDHPGQDHPGDLRRALSQPQDREHLPYPPVREAGLAQRCGADPLRIAPRAHRAGGMKLAWFDPDCRTCPRLAAFLEEVRADHPGYHARPVPPFGDPAARLLVVGLAPGMHGANATGRPFTGDHAGILLYATLHETGFASAPVSAHASDGLRLTGCRITNAVKCLPPQNRPTGAEIRNCNGFLQAELRSLEEGSVVLALGSIAHRAVVSATGRRQVDHPFGHGSEHDLGGFRLLDSYHCSRYNTQTRRLTAEMFLAVFRRARDLLEP